MTTTIITGCGRSGTSVVMQLLNEAGIDVLHGAEMGYPSFEIEQWDYPQEEWWPQCKDKTVKILDLHKFSLPSDQDFRFIVMRRYPRQQAKSAVKLLFGETPKHVTSNDMKSLEDSYLVDTNKIIALCKQHGPTLVVDFEKLITEPMQTTYDILEFVHSMATYSRVCEVAKKVIRNRETNCYDGLLEAELISEAKLEKGNAPT